MAVLNMKQKPNVKCMQPSISFLFVAVGLSKELSHKICKTSSAKGTILLKDLHVRSFIEYRNLRMFRITNDKYSG